MKVIIAGSRDITNPAFVEQAIIDSGFEITEVFCGMAPGVDEIGKLWATVNNVPLRYFPADWKKHGKAAGPLRNEQMAQEADALIAVSNGSRGTADMIRRAIDHNLIIHTRFTDLTPRSLFGREA